jgi:hypothetical protein
MNILNRYNRTSFYTVSAIDETLENDLVMNNFDLFQITRPVSYFTLTRGYIGRPDLLSLKLYNDMQYWWLILKVNTIDDPWNDMTPEKVIMVPSLLDIEDFYLAVKSKLST